MHASDDFGKHDAKDILAIARKSEPVSPTKFACSEVVRQIVSNANTSRQNVNSAPTSSNLVKEIETISIYDVGCAVFDQNFDTKETAIRQIQCQQRTATYLVPSQTDPVAFRLWQISQGRPVDVRYYDVTYTRGI